MQTKLRGKSLFTVMNMKDAYWHVKLSSQSSFLTTFNTPWGRKRFLRMPFGISFASEVMRKRNEETFGNISGIHIIADGLIIADCNDEEHDKILQDVLQRACEKGVKFNKNKIQFNISLVTYMGNVAIKDGLQLNQQKISAIVDMPQPTDEKSLQRLLGMVKYLSQYIPN